MSGVRRDLLVAGEGSLGVDAAVRAASVGQLTLINVIAAHPVQGQPVPERTLTPGKEEDTVSHYKSYSFIFVSFEYYVFTCIFLYIYLYVISLSQSISNLFY